MRVAVIGTGLIGTSVALALREHGVSVWLTDTDPEAARLAASIRRTMCLRPSCRVISTSTRLPDRSTTRNRSAVAAPSSSSTPVARRRPRSFGTGPVTSAR